MIQRSLKLLCLVLGGLCALQAQQTCNINTFSLTATGASAWFDNRTLQCASWQARYFSEGFTPVSITLQGAPDVSGAPGTPAAISASGACTLAGSNPSTVVTSSVIVATNCYFPWVRIAATLTGTGTFQARAMGAGGITASSASGGGGGGGLAITGLSGDGVATGPGNVPLTLATVNSAPGACGDATHVCRVTTNGKGLTTVQSAVAISGFTPNAITSLTGDGTASGPGAAPLTLASVASAGACGDATHTCTTTIDIKGRVLSQTPNAISGGSATGVLWSGSVDPGQPNPGFVQSNSIANNGYVLAYTSNVTSGNLLVAALGWNNGSGTAVTTISDTCASTWAQATGATVSGNTGTVYYAIANCTGPNTLTFSKTSSIDPVISLGEFSGTQAVVDAQSSQAASNAAVTSTQANDLLISGLAFNHSVNTCSTNGAGIIGSQANGTDGTCIGYQVLGTAGAWTGSIQSSAAGDTVFTNVAFKGTAVASPGSNGDYYANLKTGVLWGPKTAGTYTASAVAFHVRTPVHVAALPACSATTLLERLSVDDATSKTPGTTAAGGSTFSVAVECTFNSSGSVFVWMID